MLLMITALLGWLCLPLPLAVAVGRAFHAVEETDEGGEADQDRPLLLVI